MKLVATRFAEFILRTGLESLPGWCFNRADEAWAMRYATEWELLKGEHSKEGCGCSEEDCVCSEGKCKC